jgi:hypothetical protein
MVALSPPFYLRMTRHSGFGKITLYKIDCQRITSNWGLDENTNNFSACIIAHAVTKAKIKNC